MQIRKEYEMSREYPNYYEIGRIKQKKVFNKDDTILTVENNCFNNGKGTVRIAISSEECKCNGGILSVKTDIIEDVYKLLKVLNAGKGSRKALLHLPYSQTLSIENTEVDDNHLIYFSKETVSSSGRSKCGVQITLNKKEMIKINELLALALGIDKRGKSV